MLAPRALASPSHLSLSCPMDVETVTQGRKSRCYSGEPVKPSLLSRYQLWSYFPYELSTSFAQPRS